MLVKAANPELKTKAGIEVPHDAVASVRWGTVLSVGPSVEEPVSVGQLVCWPEFTGLVHQKHENTFFLREEELVADGEAP